MQRREFLKVIGSGASLISAPLFTGLAQAADAPGFDLDPIGGYVKHPPKTYLFTDHRLIRPADLSWLAPSGKGLPLNNPPYPVVDAHADARSVPYGVRFVAQPARIDPVEGDPPLPGGSVVETDGSYYSFGFGIDYPPGQDLGSYSTAEPNAVWISAAKSKDLQSWEDLGKCKIDIAGQTRMDGFTAFHDPHGSKEERFKAVYMAHPTKDKIPPLWEAYQKIHPRHRDVRINPENFTCIYGVTSADGINWTPIKEPLFTHYSDTDTTVLYDEWLGKYIMYTRLYLTERRMVAICEADDFRHWGPVSPLIWAGLDESLATDVYTNARTCYPGMPEVPLMFPMFYQRLDQTSDIRLFTSIDALHWCQVPGGPIVSRSTFHDSSIEFLVVSKPLLPLAKDRVGLRYTAGHYPHKYPRWKQGLKPAKTGWAWWEKGRLVALTADEEGEFTTFSLPVLGRELRINARTPRAGMIKVGLSGRPIEDCDPIFGDNFAHPVRWKGNAEVGIEPGKTVSLKFHLRKAELFGFEWVG